MNTITSFGYKYDIDGYKGTAQVDFMMVKNIEGMFSGMMKLSILQ